MSGVSNLFVSAAVAQAELARAEAAPYGSDLARWWGDCGRGDWMLWVAGLQGVDTRLVVGAALDCAELVLPELVDESREIADDAMRAARAWCAGTIGPLDCRRWAERVYLESERTLPIRDRSVALARTSALGAIESAVGAAAWADDRHRGSEFAARAARRVANTFLRLTGPDDSEAAHGRCAERVRTAIPARLIPR